MSRHHDKALARMQAVQSEVGRARPDPEPMSPQAIESFIAGFALSAPARRRIVERWQEDQRKARSAAYDEGYDDGLRLEG